MYDAAVMRSSIAIALGLLAAACGPRSTPAPVAPSPAAPIGSSVTAADGTAVFYYDSAAPLAAYAPADRGAYIVVLDGGASDERDAALADAGATAGAHLDGERYVYRLRAEQRALVEAMPFATIEGPLPPDLRFDFERLNGCGGDVDVVVELFPDTSPAVDAAIAELITSWGATVAVVAPRTLRATIPRAAIDAVARISPVRWIELR